MTPERYLLIRVCELFPHPYARQERKLAKPVRSTLSTRFPRNQTPKAKNVSERDGIDREFQLRESATALNNAACLKASAAARIDTLVTE
jgi:hypothetical protein